MHTLWKPLAMALVVGAGAHAAWAADCATEINGNDAMQYDKTSISVPASCKQFTVTLKHTGKLPKATMGHNWVLAKTADMQGVVADGVAAGLGKNYVKDGDTRVLAHTKVVGGGESDAVTFATSALKAGGPYSYFCSFPGHSVVMKGSLALAK
ncbi:azurin [Alicycliphilus denitrificans]|uniref:Azurin n=1 Tax=Alicycliphilus denitrificans (strain DSM 14773 / CIP 107495 / K601) TaxID=596154 RepID=F4GC97_ALIDK|nr:azurin [Alicycliphilus denitrificans]AEB84756.1 azurin blue-copper protein [Alicycliphilus denitrificans K601]